MGEHLIFYDSCCGLCDRAVRFVLDRDLYDLFVFAALQGKTAKQFFPSGVPKQKFPDSLILIENYGKSSQAIYSEARAVFRILWLLGGRWAVLGSFFFLPGVLFNWAYRLAARNRHRVFPSCSPQRPKFDSHRFLP